MKVLYVATVVKTHIMEFHIPYLKMLKEMGWETAVAAKNDFDEKSECVIPHCDTYFDIPFERNPFSVKNIKAYKALKTVINSGDYDIIHCHTPVGALLTRLAAKKARKRGSKVIYTAHGFHFYRGASLINWMLYYPVERILARKTDVIITIAKEDYQRAQRFKAKRIEYTPGIGIDLVRFQKGSVEKAKELREELHLPQGEQVLLSVGEVNSNKNHKAVIEILPNLPSVWYVICGRGPLIDENIKLAERLGVKDRVVFTGYRTDVVDFYSMANIFVFPSFREGLPVALMEAMSIGLVCVASRNRGTDDLLAQSKLRFDVSSRKDLLDKIQIALYDDCTEEIERNKDHLKEFGLDNVLSMVKDIYLREISRT